MYRAISWLTIVVVLGLTEGAALALNERAGFTNGSDQPIDITSTRFTARNVSTGREVTFDGNVKVLQGDLILTCDRLVIVYSEKDGAKRRPAASRKMPLDFPETSQIKSIIASGNVKIAQKERQASAAKALFDNVKRTITLSGGPPTLRRGLDSVVGDTIIVYLGEEGRFEVLKGLNSPVIKARLNPSQNWKKDPAINGGSKAR